MSAKPVKKTDSNKAWNKKKDHKKPYKEDSIPKNRTFLIVSEGANTEVIYLSSIPAPNADVVFVGGCGSKKSLVRKALELRNRPDNKGREVWCVYDLDFKGDQVRQKQDFNDSIVMAESKGMNVAYSNDAFELWFVLHYKTIEQALLRFQYYEMLSELWNIDYVEDGKKLPFCENLYNLIQNDLRASETDAIERAKKLLEVHQDKPYAEQNPCTTVFKLIEVLRDNSRKP